MSSVSGEVSSGIPVVDEPVVWYLVGSLNQAVRATYALARTQKEPYAICFMPRRKVIPAAVMRSAIDAYFNTLVIRSYSFKELVHGPTDDRTIDKIGTGLGRLMIYRVCAVRPVGWLATQGGARGMEEDLMLGQLAQAGWLTKYKWISFDELDPRRLA